MRTMVPCRCGFCRKMILRRKSRVPKDGDPCFCSCSCRADWHKRTTGSLVGRRFGTLVVVGISRHVKYRHQKWVCRCDCGISIEVQAGNLLSGHTATCGSGNHYTGSSHHNFIHGARNSRTYHIWKHIRQRCMNPKDSRYSDYGGRGIKVCPRWGSYLNFLTDMGEAPTGMSIDRKDNNGNYCPENCRWATPVEQANNSRKNVRVTIGGETRTLAEWCRLTGAKYKTVWARIHDGVPAQSVLNAPIAEAKAGQLALFGEKP